MPVAKRGFHPSSWGAKHSGRFCASFQAGPRSSLILRQRFHKDAAVSLTLKYLIAKLNDTSRRSLENAAGLCSSRSNYNVEIEHWLLKMLEVKDSDLPRLLKHYDIEPARLQRDLTA